ncbi:hypothetical protein B0J11DRAFT_219181 [Dendryphion nanum]|uniref:DUF3431 domain containing protein n=1 Tax=Dendryphion nanum TaxID=256645 RepID=A0A9P9IR76_9PLEO|nr:hypothetical protein B0J11DRAFT_219181 [Dendryphion nanum]
MPIFVRVSRKSVIITLCCLLLIWHIKAELWNSSPAESNATPAYSEKPPNDNPKDAIAEAKSRKKPTQSWETMKIPRRTAVVVASQRTENATWLEEYFPQWERNIYRVDDANAALTVPKNKGRESMVYLTYIIDNYESLPDNILFIHPNRYQWHNDDPDYDGLPMLRRFQIPHLEKEGYVNIRCAWSLGCPAEIKPLDEEGEHRAAVHAGGDYKKAFQILFPGEEVPKHVGVSCCAQFAATKEKIRRRPRADYVRYRKWLLETELGDSISGRILEYSWHIIFGHEAVHCPSAKDCYCKVFGLCGLECPDNGSCSGRYLLPPFASLPRGWPLIGWKGESRDRAGPE